MHGPSHTARLTHPALLLAGCVAGGTLLATRAGPHWAGTWGALTLFSAAVPVVMAYVWRRRLVSPLALLRTLAVGTAAVAAGALRATPPAALPPHHLARLVGPETEAAVVLTGRVVGPPTVRASGVQFVVAADRLEAPGGGTLVHGRVQVRLGQPRHGPAVTYPALESGDLLRLEGRLRAPPSQRNPADFGYGAYLRRHGIHATLAVYAAESIRVTGHAPRLLDRLANPLRRHVRAGLAARVHDEATRAVLTALLLGDRHGLDEDLRARFARMGLLHLLAVSGLHVLLVGMVLYSLLGPTLARFGLGWRMRERLRCAFTLLVLVAYVLVTGAPASVVRAVVMAALFMGGALLQRSAAPLNTLGTAALLLLLARPGHLFEAGFQLSFAAVAAIVTLHPVLAGAVPAAWQERTGIRYLVESVVTSLAATLGTLPVLLFHFGQVGLAGLLLNVPAIPLTAGTLTSGLALTGLHGVSGAGAAAFGAAAEVLTRLLLATAAFGDQLLGWTTLYTRVEEVWILAGMSLGLVALSRVRHPRTRWRWTVTAFACVTVGVWTGVIEGRHRPYLQVVFFDVGQADAALVTFPNGRHLLIDGGADAYASTHVIQPHLLRAGVRHLDVVLVSHPHRDHLGGIPALLDLVSVGRLVHNGIPTDTDLYAATFRALAAQNIPHRSVAAGDTLRVDPRVRLQILSPTRHREHDGPNEASVVLRLAYGTTTWLFMGDAEAGAEADLVRAYAPLLASDVVKVGHHGSRTSSTPAFVHAVAHGRALPVTAVVSVARRNGYGLPDEDVLARWHEAGAALHLTSTSGAAWLRTDGTDVEHVAWRRE